MTDPTVETLLATLAAYQARRDELVKEKNELLEQAVPDVVKAELKAIEDEFAAPLDAVDANVALLTEQIKSAVIALQKSVKEGRINAVYTPGRVSWNDAALKGFGLTHPEIMQFRSTGKPSVTLRIAGNQ